VCGEKKGLTLANTKGRCCFLFLTRTARQLSSQGRQEQEKEGRKGKKRFGRRELKTDQEDREKPLALYFDTLNNTQTNKEFVCPSDPSILLLY